MIVIFFDHDRDRYGHDHSLLPNLARIKSKPNRMRETNYICDIFSLIGFGFDLVRGKVSLYIPCNAKIERTCILGYTL